MTRSTAVLGGLLLLLTMAGAACGGGGNGRLSASSEEQLRQTAVQAQRVFATGEPAQAYAFFSSDFQARCPLEDFTRQVMGARALAKIGADAEIAVEAIRFEDDKAFVDITIDGTNLNVGAETSPYPYYWRMEGGEWKRTTDNPTPCPPLPAKDSTNE